MAQKRIIEIINFFRECLEEKIAVFDLILFGSQAGETATEESDIDIAVISKNFEDKDVFERAHMISEAHRQTVRKFLVPMDILTLTPEEMESEDSLAAAYVKLGTTV